MTTLQSFMYFQRYPNDTPLLKYLVRYSRGISARSGFSNMFCPSGDRGLVSTSNRPPLPHTYTILTPRADAQRVLESIHTAFCMSFMYAYLVAGFADFANFLAVDRYVIRSPYVLAKITDSIEMFPRNCRGGAGVSV